MLAVPDAQQLILRYAQPLAPVHVPLTERVLGLLLAEDVASDLDMPPFDKALMDGYAFRTADLPTGKGELKVIEEIVAGQTPRSAITTGQASCIMTGAAIPAGADAVVPVEQAKVLVDASMRKCSTRTLVAAAGRPSTVNSTLAGTEGMSSSW